MINVVMFFFCSVNILQCESKKNPPDFFLIFFSERLGIFSPNLYTYYTFQSTLDYTNFYSAIFNFDKVIPY